MCATEWFTRHCGEANRATKVKIRVESSTFIARKRYGREQSFHPPWDTLREKEYITLCSHEFLQDLRSMYKFTILVYTAHSQIAANNRVSGNENDVD